MTDAFLITGTRSPIGRYAGALAAVRPDDLAAHLIKTLMERVPSVDWAAVDEVILGNANQAGEDNRNIARMAGLLAGLPIEVPGTTMNRLCASGADAIAYGARAIKAGEADLIIAGGVESMSRAPFVMPKAESAFSRTNAVYDTTIGWRFVNPKMKAQFGIDSMPETAENVAADFAVSREDQDAFAFRSQARAAAAIASGRFAQEITPVFIPQRKGDPIVVNTDEHPRATTMEVLAKLATPFRKDGSVTAGNSSGVNDGGAITLLASEKAVKQYGLEPMARIVGSAASGVEPRIMGIGPVPAVRKVLARHDWTIDSLDIVELNEAFAAQALAVLRDLGLPDDAEHVNPNGGAIALGHPLGASGARLVLTAAIELQNRALQRAVATMCVGVGQGVAVLIERV
ncbi:MAG: 3-oxoadipyl-CoA thiolase [Dermatophilaceae bacterium]|jgi:3-oxoadipyl-CoA thiolase|nr:3-oxoadipyl-CoA thiolase [Dermatophilaceae bacterium]MBP9918108.1 3-oxoadipyl-CoA thiolase [Dermatophilaceae bacterium]